MKDSFNSDKKRLTLSTENFIFYQKSKVIILLGKATQPLISNNKVIVEKGESCKVQFKTEVSNFDGSQFFQAGSIEFIVKNTLEEKIVAGAKIKQFSGTAISNYEIDENDQRKTVQF